MLRVSIEVFFKVNTNGGTMVDGEGKSKGDGTGGVKGSGGPNGDSRGNIECFAEKVVPIDGSA